MEIGETIFSNKSNVTYTVIEILKSGGQAETAFSKSNKCDKVYFIKRLLSIKYTERNKEECLAFETNQTKLYDELSVESNTLTSCPSIVDFFRDKTFYYVVTEKILGIPCDTKELYKSLTIQDRLELFRIIVYSFYSLERHGVIHGDVKPENFLLKQVNNHFVSKLIDLESAFFVNHSPQRGYVVCTDPYSSPELMAYNDEDSEMPFPLTTKSDIFSLGVMLYEIVYGKYPESTIENAYAFEIARNNTEIKFVDTNISEELKSLIISMLKYNPEDRPNVLTVLNTIKSLKDISAKSKYCPCPYLLIERVNKELAFVHLISLAQDSIIKYEIDGMPEEIYSDPIRLTIDEVPIKTHVEFKNSDDCLYISKSLEMNISVSCQLNGRVERPYIEIIDGIVSISSPTEGSSIYYTIDNSTPSRKSNLYKEPLYLPEGTVIKAIATKLGMHSSDIARKNTSSILKMS